MAAPGYETPAPAHPPRLPLRVPYLRQQQADLLHLPHGEKRVPGGVLEQHVEQHLHRYRSSGARGGRRPSSRPAPRSPPPPPRRGTGAPGPGSAGPRAHARPSPAPTGTGPARCRPMHPLRPGRHSPSCRYRRCRPELAAPRRKPASPVRGQSKHAVRDGSAPSQSSRGADGPASLCPLYQSGLESAAASRPFLPSSQWRPPALLPPLPALRATACPAPPRGRTWRDPPPPGAPVPVQEGAAPRAGSEQLYSKAGAQGGCPGGAGGGL